MPVITYVFWCFLQPMLVVRAWDIAVFTKDEINFFNQQREIGSIGGRLKEMVAGAYDPVNEFLYVSDTNQKNASIFRVNLSRPYEDPMAVLFQSVVTKSAIIPDLAFDPVTTTLFWTTSRDNSIMKLRLNQSEEMNLPSSGEFVHRFKSEIPYGLALDSCRRTMYWTNINHPNVTIEKSDIDGSNRRIMFNTHLYQPYGIVVDQNSKKIFWCDSNGEGASFKIESSDLDGLNRQIVIQGLDQRPFGISISQNRIYWTDGRQNTLMSLTSNASGGVEADICKKLDKGVHGLVSSTLYLDIDVKACPALAPVLPKIQSNHFTETKIFKGGSTDSGKTDLTPPKKVCLNSGILKNGICVCSKHFKGQNCEIPICQNYCVGGSCEVDAAGKPICKCKTGWTGVRCEIERCRGVCLNSGKCSINPNNETVCECVDGYQGLRCEISPALLTELCKPYCILNENVATPHYLNSDSKHEPNDSVVTAEICRCSEILSTVTDRPDSQLLVKEFGSRVNVTVISTLATLCVVLGLMVLFLTIKVFTLKKRPRIRKRIVVNKPLAPFPCRPQSPSEQCEITIENCCNMNICETPCFEPEFKSSKATFSRTKSEDKRILINSMHSNSSQEDENY